MTRDELIEDIKQIVPKDAECDKLTRITIIGDGRNAAFAWRPRVRTLGEIEAEKLVRPVDEYSFYIGTAGATLDTDEPRNSKVKKFRQEIAAVIDRCVAEAKKL